MLCVAAVVFAVARSDDGVQATPEPSAVQPAATTRAPSTTAPEGLIDPDTLGVATTTRAAAIRSAPSTDATTIGELRADVMLPVNEQQEGFFAVLTPCEVRGWIAAADVRVHPRAQGVPRTLRDATIVIDPGHGGQLPGAVGPTGLPEKEPNADIARRLVTRLGGSRVFLTLSGDFTAGLAYRAAIADGLGAHAFVSIHNNAEPDGAAATPGTETYYQYRSPGSKRLAGLLYEEVVRAVEPFDAEWVADRDAGAKYRLNAQGIDYYGLLRRTQATSVLVEALFVSNGPEEALLRRPEVREAIAGAMASGLRRYFETDDPGSGYVEPYPRDPGPSGRVPSACKDPTS